MCGRVSRQARWALEAIAAGVAGAELATWVLKREDEAEAESRDLELKMREAVYPPRPSPLEVKP